MAQCSVCAETVKNKKTKNADAATEPRFCINQVIFGAVEVTLFVSARIPEYYDLLFH